MKRKWTILTAVGVVFGAMPIFTCCQKQENVRGRYEIVAEYSPETRTVAGAVKATFVNTTENEISTLKFQLYPNAYRKDALYSQAIFR